MAVTCEMWKGNEQSDVWVKVIVRKPAWESRCSSHLSPRPPRRRAWRCRRPLAERTWWARSRSARDRASPALGACCATDGPCAPLGTSRADDWTIQITAYNYYDIWGTVGTLFVDDSSSCVRWESLLFSQKIIYSLVIDWIANTMEKLAFSFWKD